MADLLRTRFVGRTVAGRTYRRPTLDDLDVTAGSHVGEPTGGLTNDSQARTAINGVRDLLVTLGLMEDASG